MSLGSPAPPGGSDLSAIAAGDSRSSLEGSRQKSRLSVASRREWSAARIRTPASPPPMTGGCCRSPLSPPKAASAARA